MEYGWWDHPGGYPEAGEAGDRIPTPVIPPGVFWWKPERAVLAHQSIISLSPKQWVSIPDDGPDVSPWELHL